MTPAAELARAGRVLADAGLVEAFGHVSARTERGFLLSPTTPMQTLRAEQVLEIDSDGELIAGDRAQQPKETPLHAAIYASRPDVGAICRTHSRAAVRWGCRGEAPPLVHGLGGLSGEVALFGDPQLVTSAERGVEAARALGHADCLLMRANGAVCTAPELAGAAVRAWFLEERARVAEECARAPALTEPAASERAEHYEAESRRAWSWMLARFCPDESRGGLLMSDLAVEQHKETT